MKETLDIKSVYECNRCLGYGKESIHKAMTSEEYTIVADTHGRLQMASGEADGHPLLMVMSENVLESHLEILRKNNVSWIATGKECIDLHRATDILGEQFGVKRLIIVGGGQYQRRLS